MGQRACKQLDEFQDICRLTECVRHIEEQPRNTASTSVQYKVTFRPGTKYLTSSVDEGFIKAFPSVVNYGQQIPEMLQGMNYEVKVYAYLIAPLIDNNICPNFIRYLNHGECDGKTMQKVLKFTTENQVKFLADTKLVMHDNTNIQWTLLATQSGGSGKLSKYHRIIIRNYQANNSTVDKKEQQAIDNQLAETWLGMFVQVLAACHAMDMSHMNHADLHFNNILVEKLPQPVTMGYVYDNVTFYIHTRYKILVYDFDMSYVEQLGANARKVVPALNTYYPKLDLYKVICGCNQVLQGLKMMPYQVLDRPENTLLLKNIRLIAPKCFVQKHFGSDQKQLNKLTDVLDSLPSVLEYIQALQVKFPHVLKNATNDPNASTFVCQKRMFDSQGRLILQSAARLRSYANYLDFKQEHMLHQQSIMNSLLHRISLVDADDGTRLKGHTEILYDKRGIPNELYIRVQTKKRGT